MLFLHPEKKCSWTVPLQGYVNIAPGDLWEDMVVTLNQSPEWNPTILESRVSSMTVIFYKVFFFFIILYFIKKSIFFILLSYIFTIVIKYIWI